MQAAKEMDRELEGGYATRRIERGGYAETDVLAIEDTEAPTPQQNWKWRKKMMKKMMILSETIYR